MFVAAIQMNSGASRERNLERAAELLRRAAQGGAKLAVLPENFSCMVAPGRPLDHAEDDGQGPVQEFLSVQARELGLWIVGGTLPLRAAGGRAHAACGVYDERGRRVARYDKIHLFDVALPGGESYRESERLSAGEATQRVVVNSPAGWLGLTVCYDLRFPELFRDLSAAGATVFSVPAAFTETTGRAHWEVLLRARAIENLAFVVAAAQSGEHPGGRRTYGHALIVGPWGEVLARAEEGEGAILADLDIPGLAKLRREFPALEHRRM